MRVRREKKKRNIEWLNQFTGSCPTCGYRLQRPQTSICPECGSFLKPVLGAPFRFSPFHAMLVSLTVSTGVVLDRLALTIVGSVLSRHAPPVWDVFLTSLVPLVVLGICIYIVWVQKNGFTESRHGKECAGTSPLSAFQWLQYLFTCTLLSFGFGLFKLFYTQVAHLAIRRINLSQPTPCFLLLYLFYTLHVDTT